MIPRHVSRVGLVFALLATTGCASVGRIGNLAEPACQRVLSEAFADILIEQGETEEIARGLAERTVRSMVQVEMGPHPFTVRSSSGTDYAFFVQAKKSRCILRLYGRQKGFWAYSNNLTFIASRPAPSCLCTE